MKSEDGKIITVKFSGVKSIKSNRPIGMILYGISEMKEPSLFRKFVFVNWDEENDAFLEIVASECIVE